MVTVTILHHFYYKSADNASMVQMAFFLRFKHQLQRIRPELVPRLEDIAVRAVEEAGGKVTGERSLIRAAFDENSLGFWLDILLLIETLTQTLEKSAGELQGYSLLLGKDMPETPPSLCRFLAGGNGGVFLDSTVSEGLRPYVTIEEQGKWTERVGKYGIGPFSRLNEIKIFIPTARLEFTLRRTNVEVSDLGQRPAVLIAGQSFEGKRDKLYLRVAGFANSADSGDFSPLFVRFGGGGLNALTDSWAGWMHSLPAEEEMNDTWEFLFRQRLRNEPSPFALRTAKRYFKLLSNSYRGLAQAEGKIPVIILENLQSAEQAMADIVIESLRGWHNFLLLGTCTGELDDEVMEKWKPLFPQLTKINSEEPSAPQLPDIPLDLREISYACFLLGKYFPPDLLPRLLEEAGKSHLMIARALSLLYTLRIIDTPLDPRPWHRDFQDRTENALGEERKDRIRAMVRGLLLAWVAQRKISPCLRLLEIIKELGGGEDIDDDLILQSIQGELAGADEASFSAIRQNWMPETDKDTVRGPVLCYIMETLLALHSGNAQDIHAAFTPAPPESSAFPLFKAQILINQALYHIGLGDTDSTLEAVKEASLLCKGSGNRQLAQIYRLFALASLVRRRVGETIDYLGFALENAGKSGGFQDIGMSAYYAASVQLLYGNLSRAKNLAEKACRHFLKAGNPEWADRSRFLMGRVLFEIGSYQQALDLFEDIRQNPEGAFFREKTHLLSAWAFRARVYCQPLQSVPSAVFGPEHDAELFEIEALCLAGDYSQTAERCAAASPSAAGDDFFCIERPDWSSGFSQCELLYCTWDDLRGRMLRAYHSIAQAALSPSNGEEAMRTIQHILRANQSPEIDPCDVFFHYAWYLILEQSGANQVDISTAVSVAFKRLQSRAARIDESEIRRQYLAQPRWNKALEEAARKLKLI
jgi:tetratricopeptide (TPR) repeat protein